MSSHGANVLWPAAHSEALKQLKATGISYKQVAEELNARFGTSYTRNAAIGRAKRMDIFEPLPPRDPMEIEAAAQARRDRKNKQRAERRREAGARTRRHVVRPPQELTALRCAEIDPLHVSLSDLKPQHCRWPFGENQITFCGHDIFQGSYCGPHFFLSLGPGTSSEQAAHKVARRHLEGVR